MSMCEICTDVLGYDEDVSAVPCGHLFHRACLSDWSKVRSSCPKCRKDFSKKFVIEKLFFDRLEGTAEDDGVNLLNKIEVLESSLMLKENETKQLVREKQQLESELSVKEIEKMELEEQLHAKKATMAALEKLVKDRNDIPFEKGGCSQNFAVVQNQKCQFEQTSQNLIDQHEETIRKLTEDNKETELKLKLSEDDLAVVKHELTLAKKKLANLEKKKYPNLKSSYTNSDTESLDVDSDDSNLSLSLFRSKQIPHSRKPLASYRCNSPATVANTTFTQGRARRGVKRCFCAVDCAEDENNKSRLPITPREKGRREDTVNSDSSSVESLPTRPTMVSGKRSKRGARGSRP